MELSWTVPLFIYFAKIIELSLNSIRIVSISKGFKKLSIGISLLEAIIWVLIVTRIIENIDNLYNIAAFGLGMATGVYVGIFIEEKLALGLVLVRIITQRSAGELLLKLRAAGFRVTDVSATSNYGSVKIMFATIKRKDLQGFTKLVKQSNPFAFFTVEDIKSASQAIQKPSREMMQQFLSSFQFKKFRARQSRKAMLMTNQHPRRKPSSTTQKLSVKQQPRRKSSPATKKLPTKQHPRRKSSPATKKLPTKQKAARK